MTRGRKRYSQEEYFRVKKKNAYSFEKGLLSSHSESQTVFFAREGYHVDLTL